jgi:single-stranded DNA-binding protein
MNNTDDFTFHGQGTLKRVDTFVSKAGKSILTLVFEIQGQYPQLIPIKVFGRLAEQATSWKPGSVLSVTGRMGGRDWNGKVYGDNVATSIEIVSEAGEKDDGTPPGHDAAPPLGDDDVPF